MAELASEYELGEEFPNAELTIVEVTEDVVAGDPLKVTGVNAAHQPKCAKHTAALPCRFVVLHDAKANAKTQVLRRGTTKSTFGSASTAGESLKCKAGKFVSSGTAASSQICGIFIDDGNADGDTGLLFFNGAMD